MDIEDLKINDVIKLQKLFSESNNNHPYEIGKNYFIRTVTMIQIGKLVQVTDQELVLESAVWVPDTGRFMQALSEGTLEEVEPFPRDERVIIGRGSLVDACVWKMDLPKEQK